MKLFIIPTYKYRYNEKENEETKNQSIQKVSYCFIFL